MTLIEGEVNYFLSATLLLQVKVWATEEMTASFTRYSSTPFLPIRLVGYLGPNLAG